jgi:hypothetical protein
VAWEWEWDGDGEEEGGESSGCYGSQDGLKNRGVGWERLDEGIKVDTAYKDCLEDLVVP